MNIERFVTLAVKGMAASYTDGRALLGSIINGIAEAHATMREGNAHRIGVVATAEELALLSQLVDKLTDASFNLFSLAEGDDDRHICSSDFEIK